MSDLNTPELKQTAFAKLREAEKALHEYACACDVGPERTKAFDLYEIVGCLPGEIVTPTTASLLRMLGVPHLTNGRKGYPC